MVGDRGVSFRWSVFVAVLDPARGSEQAGRRPVLVVSRERINQLLKVVNVVPLTSVKSPDRKVYPNEVLLPAGTANLARDSIALCYQVRTLDKSRLAKRLGEITDEELHQQVILALRFQLDM